MRKILIASIALFVAMVGLAVPAVAAAPTITSFTPTSGPLRTKVEVTGTGFTAPATVAFNGVAATSVTVNSSTKITALVPGQANSGKIAVTTSGGTATSINAFSVTPGVYIPTAPAPPGDKVAVYFSGFTAGETVDVAFDGAVRTSVTASGTGAGVATPSVPADATPGAHTFTVTGRTSGSKASAPFTVRIVWSQDGFDGSHTGFNPYEAKLGAGNVKQLTATWRQPVTTGLNEVGALVSGDVMFTVDGYVYRSSTNTYDPSIVARSLRTGATIWKQTVPGGNSAAIANPVLWGSTFVIGTDEGLFGLDTHTGAVKYSNRSTPGELTRPLTIVGGTVYARAVIPDQRERNEVVAAFDAATGTEKWNQVLDTTCDGIVVADGVLYDSCNAFRVSTVYAFRASDGEPLWERNPANGYEINLGAPPVVTHGVIIYALDRYPTGSLTAFDAKTGAQVWSRDTDFFAGGFKIATDGTRVFVRGEDAVNHKPSAGAFAVTDGATVWRAAGTDERYPITVAGGLVYIPGSTTTKAYDAVKGTFVATIPGSGPPVVTDAGIVNYTIVDDPFIDRVTELVRRDPPSAVPTAS